MQPLLYDRITKIINHTLLVFLLCNTAKYKLSQDQKCLILKVALAQCMSIFTDFRALFGQKIWPLIHPLVNPFWTPKLR